LRIQTHPDNRITFVALYRYFAGDDRHFIRPVSTAASGPMSGRRSAIAEKKKKKKKERKKKSGNKSPKTTHGRNLFDRAGGERDAFEYVDCVVAQKSLLQALWDSAMEATLERRTVREERPEK